ncbi:MAG: insulinase family protein [Oscillospiraceae bacterium]|jgi:predicted Zn-dependent peptidase|nr:insulinase family protein [Oscillospiraceae bacterium]
MAHIINSSICEGVSFSYLKRPDLKVARISISIFLPLKKENASRNAILPFLLARSCSKYPDFTSFNKKLYDLYGMALQGNVSKIGEIQILSVIAEFLDERYVLGGESISKEATELLCEVLFRPKFLQEDSFGEDLDQEKNQLIQYLESEYNDKKLYSERRCQQIMCKNERYSVHKMGTKEDLLSITPRDVQKSWENSLSAAKIRIGFIGNSEPDFVISVLKEEFSKIKRNKPTELSTQVVKRALVQKEVEEKQEIKQAKLVLGFRTRFAMPGEDCFNSLLMSIILGGTFHSKLFLNVREKLSLCYYCSSSYDRNKGIITIKSGIKKENIGETRSEIFKQIEDMKSGKIAREEIVFAKKSVGSAFMSIYDSVDRLDFFYAEQSMYEKIYSPEELVSKIEGISKDEIVNAANAITLDTVYTLVPNA